MKQFSVFFLLLLIVFWPGPSSRVDAGAPHPLKVGIYTNPPLIFTDDQGRVSGLFADVLHWIAARENWQPIFVAGNFTDCLSWLADREINLACAIGYLPDRTLSIAYNKTPLLTNWGQVYTAENSGIKDLSDLSGRQVALLKKDVHNAAFRDLVQKFGIRCDFIEVDDYNTVLGMIADGKAQAGVVSRLFGQRHADLFGLEKSGVVFNPIPVHFAFAPETDPGLIRRIDHHISALKEDKSSTYYRSLDRWFGPGATDRRWAGRFTALAGGGGALIGILVLGNMFLRRQVRLKTRELTAELEHREHAEAYIRSVFRASPIGIGVVTNRIFTQVNQKVMDMTGYTEAELLGKNARMLYPSDAEYTYVGTEKYRQIQKHGTGTVETVWQVKSGSRIHVLLSSTPLSGPDLSGGVTFSALDITVRKQAELLLQKSEKQYRTLFEKTNDAIFLISAATGQYLDANPAAQALTGRSLAALKDAVISDHAAPHGAEGTLDLTPGIQKDQGDFIFTRPDGSRRVTRLSTAPLTETVLIGFAKDVTHDLEMEKQLRQAQKMESIGTLAGGIAHDFNNILFPIMGFTEMLLDDSPEKGSLRRGLNQIYASATRAKELVAQILAFSRQSHTAPMPVTLQPIVKEAMKLLRATIPTTIDMVHNIDRHCSRVIADPTQIHQIVINLATNAFHAMEETGGTLTITLDNHEVPPADGVSQSPAPGSYVRLLVSDTGPGIPGDIQDKIFDPFFTTKEKGRGTGMGLSVVHGIVSAVGGCIRVDSEPGKGATFHIYLPRTQADPAKWNPGAEPKMLTGTESVLLVDDEPGIISMETRLLRRMGYRVTAFTSSLEALDAFKSDPSRFDLVISDVAMPGMAGDRLAREMLNIRPDTPILLCSGFSETMNEEKAVALGSRGFMLKPMTSRNLSVKIRQALTRATCRPRIDKPGRDLYRKP